MAEKIFNGRIVQKHDLASNWSKSSFIPKKGEIVIFDIDDDYDYERLKIGDGETNVNELPFVDDNKQDKDFIVTLTAGQLSADKTFAEITAAHNAGRRVVAKRFTMQFPLIVLSDDMAIFALEIVKDMSYIHFYCSSDNVWQESSGNAMPDVSGPINTHNTSVSAHADIRTSINELSAIVGDKSVSEQITEAIANKANVPKITSVTLLAANWTGDANPWFQVVTMNGVTANSKVDLQPSAFQIVELQNEDIAFIAENNDGTVTVYALGGKPTVDYTMQALITEVASV